jgi:class 3 adenylate cyclase
MAHTCPACGAGVAEDARFCAACGSPLAGPQQASEREVRKVVTVLFADVTGSTALGERLDPETLRRLMNRYFARIRSIVEAHGGTVEKFIGDAVMAVFGIPRIHEDDALRAVRAAWAIREALASLNAELTAERGVAIRFRTGVNTGEVVSGDPSTGTTLVTGDTVNTAARLEQAAAPGEILLGRLTYSLVRDAVDAEPMDAIEAKGKADPVQAWSLRNVRAGTEGRARRLDALLVGRERELDRLTTAYRSAVADRACTLFTLLGPAGVGKSRLTAEFLDAVAGDATVLRGRCLSYGEGITYWPLGEIVRGVAGITEADDAEAARRKLRAVLGDSRDADGIAAPLGAAIGLSVDQAPKEEVAWAFRRFLEALAAERPLVVVIEDIHWAEPTLLDLIEHVADWIRDAAVLLLCPARPELLDAHPAWAGGKLNSTTLLLEPLGADAVGRLIQTLPGGAALPPRVAERVMAAAEGNPLYVEELLGMLVDDDVLRRDTDGTWVISGAIDEVQVPPSIGLLVAARLERLAPAERRVAEHASVVGRVFEQAAVVELAPDEARSSVPAALLALVRKELVRPERGDVLTTGDAFKFRHVLIRDAAYEALPKAERADLHERVAAWLEDVAGDRVAEIEEIVGHHLGQAVRYRRELGEAGPRVDALARQAHEHLAAAGMRAVDRGDPATSVPLLRHAIAVAPSGTETDVLELRLIDELMRSDRAGEAGPLADALRARAAGTGNVISEARAALAALDAKRMILGPGSGHLELSGWLAEGREIAERSGDAHALAAYWRMVSIDAWEHELFPESHEALVRALELSRAADDQRGVREIQTLVLMEHLSGTTPLAEAFAHADTMLVELGRRRDDHAFVLARRGLIRGMLGDRAAARADILESEAIHLDLGMVPTAAEAAWYLAWTSRLAGDHVREAEEFDRAVRDVEPAFRPFMHASRGFARVKAGRAEDARQDLEASAQDPWYRTIRVRKALASRLALREEDARTALDLADEIEAEVLPQEHFLNARSEWLFEIGVIAALAGETAVARRRGELALETATRKGNVAMVRRATALLAGDVAGA